MKFVHKKALPKALIHATDALAEPLVFVQPIHHKKAAESVEDKLMMTYFFMRHKESFAFMASNSPNSAKRDFCLKIVARINEAMIPDADESIKALSFKKIGPEAPTELLSYAAYLSSDLPTSRFYIDSLLKTRIEDWSTTTLGDVASCLLRDEEISLHNEQLAQKMLALINVSRPVEMVTLSGSAVDSFEPARTDLLSRWLDTPQFSKWHARWCSALLFYRGFNTWNLGLAPLTAAQEHARARKLLDALQQKAKSNA